MIVKVVNKSCNCLYALFSLSTEIFSRVNKYLECQVVNSFFSLFLSSSGGRCSYIVLSGMQILGALWALIIWAQLFDWLKVGLRCSFPPLRSGREKRGGSRLRECRCVGVVVRHVLSER